MFKASPYTFEKKDMRKKIFTLLSLLFICLFAYARPPVVGYWKGGVSRDGAIQAIEVNFYIVGDSIRATYNLPDLGLYEEPVLLHFTTDTTFSFRAFMGSFNCFYNKEHAEITGENKLWKPVGLKMHLKKVRLPKTDHTKELLAISSGDINIKGTLFKPVNQKRSPLVIIAHGADDPTRKNWVYRYYAYMLVKEGYAVFIFDQRGNGESGGKDATLHDNASDIISIARYFKTRKYIEPKRMAIIGESRGGWVAPIAAQSGFFKTIILLAGPAKSPVSLETDVVEMSLSEEGYRKAQIDSALDYTRFYFKTIKDPQLWSSLKNKYDAIKKRPWADVLQDTDSLNDEGMQWWKQNEFDPAVYLTKVRSSVLAVFGSKDILVPAIENEMLMKDYLTRSGQKFKTYIISNLPHGLYFYSTLIGNEFLWPENFWIWPKRSIEMDELIIDWLKERL
jgi:pimeloyl-ACP methyl ester carboxylesterase